MRRAFGLASFRQHAPKCERFLSYECLTGCIVTPPIARRMRGSMPVSIREVAAHAGVSVATVSNVLNRPEIVAQPTRDRVNASIRKLGFVRNESARQLRAGRSRTIGLVVLDVANPFFTDVARGVEDEASESGLSVLLCNSNNDNDRERHYLSLLQEQRAFGILITPVGKV